MRQKTLVRPSGKVACRPTQSRKSRNEPLQVRWLSRGNVGSLAGDAARIITRPGKILGKQATREDVDGGDKMKNWNGRVTVAIRYTYRKSQSLFSLPPMSVPPTPLSPSSRKHKAPPSLPLSVFTPPSTGTADRFPFPPSPTSVTAGSIVDASVVVSDDDLGQWNLEATSELKNNISGVVLLVKADDVQQLVEKCVTDRPSSLTKPLNLTSLQGLNQRFLISPSYPSLSPSASKTVPRSAYPRNPKSRYHFLLYIQDINLRSWRR